MIMKQVNLRKCIIYNIPCEDCQLELIAQGSLKEHIERKHNQTNVTWKDITDTNMQLTP